MFYTAKISICQVRYHQCCRSHAREQCKLHQSEWVLFLGHPCPVPSLYHPKQEYKNKVFLLHVSSHKFSIQYYSQIKRTVPRNGSVLLAWKRHQQNTKTTPSSMNSRIHVRHPSLTAAWCICINTLKQWITGVYVYQSWVLAAQKANVKTTESKRQELSIFSRLQAPTVHFARLLYMLYRKIKSLKRDTLLYSLYDKDLFAYTFLKARPLYPVVIL